MADAIRQRRKHFYKDREERTYEKVGQQMKTGYKQGKIKRKKQGETKNINLTENLSKV